MTKSEFTFDEWVRLASKDPEAFEKERERTIRQVIAGAPSNYRTRLLRLQWRVDMERKRHPNPMSACVNISRMMLDSVYGEHGLANALTGQGTDAQPASKHVDAKVLDLNEYR